jgi:hypothetical protein
MKRYGYDGALALLERIAAAERIVEANPAGQTSVTNPAPGGPPSG